MTMKPPKGNPPLKPLTPLVPAYAIDIVFAAALVLATLIAYQPAWHGTMLWDDNAHLTPPQLRSAEGLRRIWFELRATQQYYPLTHSAFWLQHKLWGDDTFGYHIVNILLHATSAILFFVILRRLRIPGAYLAAVIFALQPVHVESVAWISELKNTLSGALYLGSALAYLYFDERRSKGLYALALLLFVLALMSKSVTATLPAALLVVFWWQRGRLDWRRDVLPLAPFFALGIAGGLFTAWVEQTEIIGVERENYRFSVMERILLAGRAIWFYLSKLIWPANLIFFYPRWNIDASLAWQYLFPLGVLVLLGVLWWLRQHTRAPLAAVLIFCGTLFPVLGFFNIYPFKYSFVADHFQYHASLAMIALFAAGVALLFRRWRLNVGPAALLSGLAIAGVAAALTWQQSSYYVNAETLYTETLKRNPGCWNAQYDLGNILRDKGYLVDAIKAYQKALAIKKDYADAHNNWGAILLSQGRDEEAGEHFQQALDINPNFADAHNNLGATLLRMGNFDLALRHCLEAERLNPRLLDAKVNAAMSLHGKGKTEDALMRLREAEELSPDEPTIQLAYGQVLHDAGQLEAAALHIERAVQLQPQRADARYFLASIFAKQGRLREAVLHLEHALELNRSFKEAYDLLEQIRAAKALPNKTVP